MQDGYIGFHNISKRFRRGEIHDSLRDLLPYVAKRLLPGRKGSADLEKDEFSAVRNVDFEVRPGTTLGLIGGNGAGKSTCLKLLTRILRPTHGQIEVRGRIGSLIEISAGFHGDLTGRENVFLQGVIMGMSIAQIRQKFDQIVEFSGITDFLDTPVKRYSSGMHARLGFSIAAHLDPDVLIIDEVLSVGDHTFQNRAFGRIRDLATSGIPVVIVSHQLDRIAELCTDVIVLDHGAAGFRGTPVESIGWYLAGGRAGHAEAAMQTTAIGLQSLQVIGDREVDSGAPVRLELSGRVADDGPGDEQIVLRVSSTDAGKGKSAVVGGTATDHYGVPLPERGPFRLEVTLNLNLRPAVFAIQAFVVDRKTGYDVSPGPIAYVQVHEDPGFIGMVQLNPEMRLIRVEPVEAPAPPAGVISG